MMTADPDLIRREDALAAIHKVARQTYTPARKNGLKEALNIVRRMPIVKAKTDKHSHWFVASGWWLCDYCGGRSSDSRCTPFCPWCGAAMDEFLDEIE